MKYALHPHTEIRKIPADTEEVHFIRPIKAGKIEKLLRKCKGLHTVSMSESTRKRLKPKARKLLDKAVIHLKVNPARGRAIGIDLEKMLRVIELRKDYQSLRGIEELTGVPKSTVHYLVKYADRQKVKKDGEIIYLK